MNYSVSGQKAGLEEQHGSLSTRKPYRGGIESVMVLDLTLVGGMSVS